jgi:hypothetical protein
VSILMTSEVVLSLCKKNSVFCNCFVLLLYFFSQAVLDTHLMASLLAHNRVPIHKPTQQQGVYKCIRVRTAPQPCYKGGNSLREFDDARRTHRRSPGGPSCTCSACSATASLDKANNAKRMWIRMLLCQRTER